MAPNQVYHGEAEAIYAARQVTLDQAFSTSPERFVRNPPRPPAKPTAAWINPPATAQISGANITKPAASYR